MSSALKTLSGCMTVGCLALLACSDSTTDPLPSDSARSAAVVPFSTELATLGWQAQTRSLVATNGLSPLAAARVYAAVSMAQYKAIKVVDEHLAIDGALSENGLDAGGRSQFEARRGAVGGASTRVLSHFFPSAAAGLEQQLDAEGEVGPGAVHPDFTRGVLAGRAAGNALVDWVSNDRFTAPWTGTVPIGLGLWIANGPPIGATLGNAQPYFLTSGSQFRPPPPPVFASDSYNTDLLEVLTIAQNRSPAQIASAQYWNYPGGTPTPPGFWNESASAYIDQDKLDERAATHVYALMHAAIFDAQIACWDAKYYYWMIRPPQAEPAITLVFGLPNHPSYPSGHSCVSGAAARVLSHFFPARASEVANWMTEAGLSRIYAGIHYRFDITAGNALGDAVARWAINADQDD